MKKYIIYLKAILIIFVALIYSNISNAVSIGVSPGRVNFNNILPGGYAEKIITISTNSDSDLTADIEVTGEISSWLSFKANDTIALSRASPYKLVIVTQPPADIPTGSYSGKITIVTGTAGSVAGRAGGLVKAAVTVTVGIDITNIEVSNCRAGGFNINDVEIGYPLELSSSVSNEGNVRVSPEIGLDIWDQEQENLLLATELISEEVLPTTQQTVRKNIANSLSVGQYWANVRVPECGASGLLTFSIVEKGAIADKGILKDLINDVWAFVGEPVSIKAIFENQGQRSVFARFKGVIKLEDKIVKVIETDEINVPAGETSNLEFFYTPVKPGRYVITGRVIYNKKLTFERGGILNVNPKPDQLAARANFEYLPLILYVTIIITILFLLRKISKEKKRKREIF